VVVIVYLLMISAFFFALISVFGARGEKISVLEEFETTIRLKPRHYPANILEKIGRINIPFLKVLKMDKHYIKLVDKSGINLSYFGLFALKELSAIAFFFGSGFLNLSLKSVFMIVVAGFFLPDLWLLKKSSAYRRDLLRVLPETVDLVNLCIGAGLDFMGAVKWLINSKISFKSPLIKELAQARREVDIGKARVQALIDMEKRLGIAEISSFVRMLVAAEKLGTPISEVMDSFSADCRENRFHGGERKAKMAALKILFPLIFCILPTVAVIIVGPIFLQFKQQGFGAGF